MEESHLLANIAAWATTIIIFNVLHACLPAWLAVLHGIYICHMTK
jgi:hypothetical protein